MITAVYELHVESARQITNPRKCARHRRSVNALVARRKVDPDLRHQPRPRSNPSWKLKPNEEGVHLVGKRCFVASVDVRPEGAHDEHLFIIIHQVSRMM